MSANKVAKATASSSQVYLVIDGANIDSVHAYIESANERASTAKKEGKSEFKVEAQELQGGSIVFDEKKAVSKTRVKTAAKVKAPKVESSEDEESDEPVIESTKKPGAKVTKAPTKSKPKSEETKEAEAPKANTAKTTKSVGEQRAANAKKPVKPDDSDLPNNIKALLAGSGSVFAGKTLVVTGIPPTLGRKHAETLVTVYGGKLVKALSKKTDYVVVGNEAGPKKLEQISELGIKSMDEDSLIAMLEGGLGNKRGAEDDGHDEEEEPQPTKTKRQKKSIGC